MRVFSRTTKNLAKLPLTRRRSTASESRSPAGTWKASRKVRASSAFQRELSASDWAQLVLSQQASLSWECSTMLVQSTTLWIAVLTSLTVLYFSMRWPDQRREGEVSEGEGACAHADQDPSDHDSQNSLRRGFQDVGSLPDAHPQASHRPAQPVGNCETDHVNQYRTGCRSGGHYRRRSVDALIRFNMRVTNFVVQ